MLAEGALIFLLNSSISENNKDAIELNNGVIYTFPKKTTYLIKEDSEASYAQLPRKFDFGKIYKKNLKEK